MTNNIIKTLITILVILFFTLVTNYYFSEKNINLVKKNRKNLDISLYKNISELPVLTNDTNDVIEFNTGIEKLDKKNFKRNFWELFN